MHYFLLFSDVCNETTDSEGRETSSQKMKVKKKHNVSLDRLKYWPCKEEKKQSIQQLNLVDLQSFLCQCSQSTRGHILAKTGLTGMAD